MDISISEVEANGLKFKVRTAGPAHGKPVILLHGFPQTSLSLASQLLALGRAGYRAVAFDQRGYSPGARPERVEAYRLPELVSDVGAVADVLGIVSFDLVGHDWGGLVGWATAAALPSRVRSYSSVSTPHPNALAAALAAGDPDQTRRSAYLDLFVQVGTAEEFFLGEDGSGRGLRQLFADSGISEDAVSDYLACLCEPGALTAALNWYRANDLHQAIDIAPITVPVMYVWSTDDIALGRLAAETTAEYVKGPYRFEVFEGVTHWIPDVAPERLNQLLLEQLGRDT